MKTAYKKLNSSKQMSDTFFNAVFLTLSGGFQDAYTYICRGKVFANAQTGNIVLMSTHIFDGEWNEVFRYLIPVISFLIGICIAEMQRYFFKSNQKIHWRQIVLFFEMFILFGVGFLPSSFDMLANSLVSFVAAMQVQTFRKLNGNSYASTMCIGNMRSGAEALCGYIKTKNIKLLEKSLNYFGIIFLFAVGAGLGGILTELLGIKAIWISCVLLFISFSIMFVN